MKDIKRAFFSIVLILLVVTILYPSVGNAGLLKAFEKDVSFSDSADEGETIWSYTAPDGYVISKGDLEILNDCPRNGTREIGVYKDGEFWKSYRAHDGSEDYTLNFSNEEIEELKFVAEYSSSYYVSCSVDGTLDISADVADNHAVQDKNGTALESARNAEQNAQDAKSAANNAESTANSANTNANQAKNAAQDAYDKADSANSNAWDAKQNASDAKDAAQTAANKVDDFNKDNVSPEIKKIKGKDGATATEGSTFDVTVKASDNKTTSSNLEFRAKADTGSSYSSWTPISDYATATGISGEGSHDIAVEVRDEAGNIAEDNLTIFKL